jgi:hypothetical protein
MGTVYVQHIESQRHFRDPLRFGDDLLRKNGGSNRVEDVDRIQGNRPLASKAPGRERLLSPLRALLARALVARALAEGGDEALSAGEVPIQR